MKKFYALTLLFAGLLFAFNAGAATGIFQTYVIYDVNGGGPTYAAGGANADGAPSFDGTMLGTVTSLVLNGGEVKTFKNSGGNVTGAEINYQVFAGNLGDAGAPGGFTAINLPFDSNIGGTPFNEDQKWDETGAGVDLLAGLPPGDYVLQVWWRAFTNEGDRFDTNAPIDYQASFTVAPPATVPTLGQWGLIIFGLVLLCSGAIVVWRRQYQVKEVLA